MHPYITIGGIGSRLKCLSPKDKYLLYYKNRRIIEWILEILPEAKIIGEEKTSSRKETLGLIPEKEDILIIDCDIIPFGFSYDLLDTDANCVFAFVTSKTKYGSIEINQKNVIIKSDENNNISKIKCSGIYYIKNLEDTMSKMLDNSIVSGMIGSKIIIEDSFMRFGDAQDYLDSIGQL